MSDIHPSWQAPLAPVANKIRAIMENLQDNESHGIDYLPRHDDVLRAFRQPFDQVRVLIVGQDPYPTPGHAIGLAFAVARDVHPLPRSLQNIYHELSTDLGITPPKHGDLSAWTSQGVLLLNRVLTVSPGQPQSHAHLGWQQITEQAIAALAKRQQPLVAILWGKQAQSALPLLGNTPTITSAHPSPLSARRGFFGSRPFSRTNELLIQQNSQPINWDISAT